MIICPIITKITQDLRPNVPSTKRRESPPHCCACSKSWPRFSTSYDCGRSVVFSGYSSILHQYTCRYNKTDIMLKVALSTITLIYIYKRCFKSLPFSQANRIKRIYSTVETTKQRLGDLCHDFKRRGYNNKVIESGFSKASEINRNNLLVYKEKKINKRVPFVLT